MFEFMKYANLNNEDDTLHFIEYLLNNSIIKNHIKTEIVENELKIICDDKTTIYKLSIRS